MAVFLFGIHINNIVDYHTECEHEEHLLVMRVG